MTERIPLKHSRFPRNQPFLLFMFLLLPALLVVSCGKKAEVAGDKIVRISISSNPKSLDPAFNTDVNSGVIAAKIFNGLVRFSGADAVPDLAESWTVSDDGLVYTFRIRSGVKFHNGKPLTAESIEKSFARLLLPGLASPRQWVFENIAIFRADGPETFVVELKAPSASFLSKMAMPPAYVIYLNAADEENPSIIGSGPYKLVKWEDDSEVLLETNSDYFGDVPAVDGISYRILPEATTSLALLRSGDLDVVEIPQSQFGRFKEDPQWRDRIQKADELAVVYLAINTERHSDPKVRRALNASVEREVIIDKVLGGLGSPAAAPIPPAIKRHTIVSTGYEPVKHREILADAFGDKELVLLRSAKQTTLAPTEAIAGYLRDAGLKVRVEPMEFASLQERIERSDYDFAYLNWYADYPDPENFLIPLFHSSNLGAAGNRARLSNPKVDAAVMEVAATIDPEKRRIEVEEAERLVVELAPWIFLWYPSTAVAVSERLTGYTHPVVFNEDKGTSYFISDAP